MSYELLKYGGVTAILVGLYSKCAVPILNDPSLAEPRRRLKEKVSEVAGDTIFTIGAVTANTVEFGLEGIMTHPDFALLGLGALSIGAAYKLGKRK